MEWKWYSTCSRHWKVHLDCPACVVGHWINEDSSEVLQDRKLWYDDPDGWREKHASDRLVFQQYTDMPH